MKKIILALVTFLVVHSAGAQIYKAKDGGTEITFFSSSPLEDITATNKGAVVVMNTNSGDVQFRVTIQNFKFKNSLMEEHFNENYMESQKYPNAVFKGKIAEKVDFTKDGETKVSVTGKMEIHGVTKDVTQQGTITVKGSEIKLYTKFPIKVADYNIKVPSLYVKNIAEVVDVTVSSVLEPFQKK
jgi:polyisoprenoid-binding protein YceI